MNDNSFQEWSDALSEIRQSRLTSLENLQKEKNRDFAPKDFVGVAKISLDEAIGKWWGFEKESIGEAPSSESQDDLPSEMESVIDFEMEAIQRDLDGVQKLTQWNQKIVDKEMAQLENFSNEIKRSYLQKIDLLKGGTGDKSGSKKPSFTPINSDPLPDLTPLSPAMFTPTSSQPISPPQAIPRVPRRASGRSGGGGVVMFLMLVVGLLIGTGPSIYFWDQASKTDVVNQEKISQLQSEKRALEDNVSVVQKNFVDLATGKKKTIPQLEEAMRPIHLEISTRREKIEKEFKDKKENLFKKTPAGDRWDRAAKKLKDNRDEHLEALAAEEKVRLEPYLKQIQLLKELMEK